MSGVNEAEAHEIMPCDEVEALLPLVTDGAIDCDDDPQLFAHVAQCPDCQRSLAAHDLVDLALAADRAPTPNAVVTVVPWPLAIGGGLLTAAAVTLAVWFNFNDNQAHVPVSTASVQVIEVIEREDGRSSYVIERDGEQFIIEDFDRAVGASDRVDAIPVVAPAR